mmetsp:Transcript_8116/g.15976  ORF Transcript_8116/g.15976 Transcript_8116/m.15976 type:complete len:237 (+) Transcript_8116:1740-2450(+)
MFVRESLTSTDVLNCPDPNLRKAFAASAPSVGKLVSDVGTFTAHVLHFKPLLIGTASSAVGKSATFEPLTPFAYSRKVQCVRISDEQPPIDYAVLQCEPIYGAEKSLVTAFPSLTTQGDQSILAFSTEHDNKAVSTSLTTEPSFKGAIQTPLGSNKISAVVGKDGLINVDDLHGIYDKYVWPIVKLGFRDTENHFFTYFRQYEVLHNLPHKGRENRWWTNTRFNKTYRELRRRLGI